MMGMACLVDEAEELSGLVGRAWYAQPVRTAQQLVGAVGGEMDELDGVHGRQ